MVNPSGKSRLSSLNEVIMEPRVCWLDFGWQNLYTTNPHDVDDWLREAGFQPTPKALGCDTWVSKDFPNVFLEVLNVDSYPPEQPSQMEELTSVSLDEDRRRVCLPHQMDPFFRCMVYSVNDGKADHLAEAASLLRKPFDQKPVYCLWE